MYGYGFVINLISTHFAKYKSIKLLYYYRIASIMIYNKKN